jgi:hypothetical protein
MDFEGLRQRVDEPHMCHAILRVEGELLVSIDGLR